ncbi:MAG: ImmA/IrrE family metallo-endopeptidase [Thermoplasmata archaeon]
MAARKTPPPPTAATPPAREPPSALSIDRALAPGSYPLLTVFRGLDRVPAFRKYPCGAAARQKLARETRVELLRRPGEWMYVAPREVPPDAPKEWRPVTSQDECVVIGHAHLTKSPSMVLYLDILHELYHVLQRQDGRELWDDRFEYVDRPTEVEAYAFAVEEARRLGASDAFLREYLKVEWVNSTDHLRLLKRLGVTAPVRRRSNA